MEAATGDTARAAEAGRDAPSVLVYADVPNRLVGIVLDAAFLSLLVFAGAVLLSAAFGPAVRLDLDSYAATVDERLAVANAVLALVLGAAYFVGSYLLLGASPGHRLLTMRLRGSDGAARVTPVAAVLRWLLLVAPFGVAAIATTLVGGVWDVVVTAAVVAWYLVLLVTTARHPAKQGLHDRAARTLTVKPVDTLAAPLARGE